MLKRDLKVPFGVNYLWDPVATVALGVATGARFGREIFTGVYASDMGLWAARLRRGVAPAPRSRPRRLQAAVQHQCRVRGAARTRGRSRSARRSAVFSSLADIICVSGPMTGQAVDNAELTRVKKAVKDTPVFANTGVNIEQCARHSAESPTAASSAPTSRSTATPGMPSTATA